MKNKVAEMVKQIKKVYGLDPDDVGGIEAIEAAAKEITIEEYLQELEEKYDLTRI